MISASVYYDGTIHDSIFVRDNTIAAGANVVAQGKLAGVPDVIIGNNEIGGSYNDHTDYILASAFLNTGGQIEIDYYNVHDNGTAISIGNLQGVYQITKGLTFTTQFATNATNVSGKLYQNTWHTQDSNVVKKSNLHNMLTESRNDNRQYTINNLLNYTTNFGDHGLRGLRRRRERGGEDVGVPELARPHAR